MFLHNGPTIVPRVQSLHITRSFKLWISFTGSPRQGLRDNNTYPIHLRVLSIVVQLDVFSNLFSLPSFHRVSCRYSPDAWHPGDYSNLCTDPVSSSGLVHDWVLRQQESHILSLIVILILILLPVLFSLSLKDMSWRFRKTSFLSGGEAVEGLKIS